MGSSCGQLPSGMTGTGPLIGPPAFISVPEPGEGVGGDVLGGMAGVLGAVWVAPDLLVPWLVPCAPATVGVCSIPHIIPSTRRAISTSPPSATMRVISR